MFVTEKREHLLYECYSKLDVDGRIEGSGSGKTRGGMERLIYINQAPFVSTLDGGTTPESQSQSSNLSLTKIPNTKCGNRDFAYSDSRTEPRTMATDVPCPRALLFPGKLSETSLYCHLDALPRFNNSTSITNAEVGIGTFEQSAKCDVRPSRG